MLKPFITSIAKLTTLLMISSLVLAGCSSTDSSSTNASGVTRLQVIATTYPMVEFSKQVAGDLADVTGLIPTGTEPHDWEPTAKDMKKIKSSGVFVYNGAGLEGWAEKALKSVNKDKVSVVEASKGIELIEGIHEEEDPKEKKKSHDHDEELDPHVWLSPALAQNQVLAILAGFEKADPTNKDQYKKNADAYIAKLQDLDKAFKSGLSNVKRKEFVTQHAAFGYLAKQYGLVQVPIAGLSPDQEPTAAKMTEIVKFAREKQVKTIFFETLVSPKIANTIAKEIGAKTAVLNPIEGLTEEDKKNNLDYIGIMKQNLNALVTALNE
jgi:zinc transport system substrate-binding protein